MGGTQVPEPPLTQLLHRWTAGDPGAFEELIPLIYEDLRRLARLLLMKERAGHSLSCTALVHESYLRLMGTSTTDWESRTHFFGAAARAMRRVLVDHARARNAQKRGDGSDTLALDEVIRSVCPDLDLLALDLALDELAGFAPEAARVVELRYFVGLTIEESAAILGSSPATVKRDWTAARAWLYRRIAGVALE